MILKTIRSAQVCNLYHSTYVIIFVKDKLHQSRLGQVPGPVRSKDPVVGLAAYQSVICIVIVRLPLIVRIPRVGHPFELASIRIPLFYELIQCTQI